MKNKILLIVLLLIFSNCEIKTRESKGGIVGMYSETYYVKGMQYVLYGTRHNDAVGLVIVNVTKDSLEVEWLKKQLNQIK